MVRPTEKHDVEAIMKMIGVSGQFDADGLEHVRSTLEEHLASGSRNLWLTADDSEPVGVAYCAPEPVAPGGWNLLMLWIRPDRHGRGHGSALVQKVESMLEDQAARLLIVETSGLPDFAPARAFYQKCGFVHEATIKSYFAQGDDKLVLTKLLPVDAA